MKTYIHKFGNIHGSNNSIQQMDDNSLGEIISSSEEEVSIGSEASEEILPSPVYGYLFVNADHTLYSVSSWFHNFTIIMPETHIVNIPKCISDMMSENCSIVHIQMASEMGNFSQKLMAAIAKVGGTAFIKNNWHSPKDAAMYSPNHLLKVNNVHDVINYMINSAIISNDFYRELGSMPFCVAVRPWVEVYPATEFRCIVVHNKLVGITPRKWPKYYAHFKDIMPALIDTIGNLFFLHIKGTFLADHYIFDVIYTSPGNVQLWDFGPLNESSKLHAFLWEEIENIIQGPVQERSPVFRYLVEDCGILSQNSANQDN